MTQEEIIELLTNMKNNTTAKNSGEQEEVNREIEEIDATIEEYNEKIEALEEKIANLDNYQYEEVNKEERELTTELLEESFANQLEVIEREIAEYASLQNLATSIFTDYNLEIATLNNDIAAIERRLRKNDIAVRKNIGIRLTDDELNTLNADLELKRARILECEDLKAKYVEELRNYGELITANNRKKEIVTQKQERLNAIKQDRFNNPKTVDNVKLRNDKDELASLKAGVAALVARKNSLSYNMGAEIDKLITHFQKNQEVKKENKGLDDGVVANKFDTEEKKIETDEFVDDKSQALINAYAKGTEGLTDDNKSERIFTDEERITYGKNKGFLGIPEVTTGHDFWLAQNSDLDNLREAEIEEANEELKKKKKDNFFKKHWKKFVAGAIAVVVILTAKGCHDTKKAGDYLDNNSISISVDDDKFVDDEIKVPTLDDIQSGKVPVFNTEETGDKTVVNNDKNDTVNKPGTGTNTEVDDKVDTEEKPGAIVKPGVDDDTVEKGVVKAELESGEKIISTDDLIKGEITDDTVVSHGDEVGKVTGSGLDLEEYTEKGKAVVTDTLDGTDGVTEKVEGKVEEKISKDQVIKNLEEFMGGAIEFTDTGDQWLDEIVSGKSMGR